MVFPDENLSLNGANCKNYKVVTFIFAHEEISIGNYSDIGGRALELEDGSVGSVNNYSFVQGGRWV